jgi:methyltransferase (TIGR00027 family)
VSDPLVRDISDTALWMAVYRARETERPDAHFRDPFAKALAGDRGVQISSAATASADHSWAFTTRTVLFDRFISEEIARGADVVVNLAAGVDARPYRMDLPATLQWIEVDLPSIIEYKAPILSSAAPKCRLERVSLDLGDVESRRRLFADIGRHARRALVVSEGLLVYLSEEEVGSLATDLAAIPTFERWAVDFPSPALLKMMEQGLGKVVRDAGAPFKFAPPDGPDFFRRYGWHPVAVESMLKTAGRLNRLPMRLRMFSFLPDSRGKGSRPWSGVCLLEREPPASY